MNPKSYSGDVIRLPSQFFDGFPQDLVEEWNGGNKTHGATTSRSENVARGFSPPSKSQERTQVLDYIVIPHLAQPPNPADLPTYLTALAQRIVSEIESARG